MDRKDGARRHKPREETVSSKKHKNKRKRVRRGVNEVGEARNTTVQSHSKATASVAMAGNNSHYTMKQINRGEDTSLTATTSSTALANHTPQANPSDATQAGRRKAYTGGGKKGKKRRRQEAAGAAAAELEAPKSRPSSSARPWKPLPVSPSSRERSDVAYVATKKAKNNGRRANAINRDHSTGSTWTSTSLLPELISGKHGGTPRKPVAGSAAPVRLSELQKRMRQKLEGAQFRMINEALYTCESGASLAKFREEPELFDVYHRGFREQVEKWPVHPLDIIIDWLGKYPKARVADFGCGEARLAASVPNKVHSFDLVSRNPRVIACDMAHVPLQDASVNIVVFCLSLMGTNLADFLREAHRVLVRGGIVKVAEVRSRFEGEKGGVERFLEVARRLGFDKMKMDQTNKMFLLAEFRKSSRTPEEGVTFEAKACLYKRR